MHTFFVMMKLVPIRTDPETAKRRPMYLSSMKVVNQPPSWRSNKENKKEPVEEKNESRTE